MSLDLDVKEARQADRLNSAIRESGKYIGVITRAEKLLSKNDTEGFGLSFKSDDGATANYLDLYTLNASGEKLPSLSTVQAILCCTKTKSAEEGNITFEVWDSEAKEMVKKTANGYPILIGKRIGLLLQREISDNPKNADKPNDRPIIFGVFEADTEFTASEILDKATKPEKLAKMMGALILKPVNNRCKKPTNTANNVPAGSGFDYFEDAPF